MQKLNLVPDLAPQAPYRPCDACLAYNNMNINPLNSLSRSTCVGNIKLLSFSMQSHSARKAFSLPKSITLWGCFCLLLSCNSGKPAEQQFSDTGKKTFEDTAGAKTAGKIDHANEGDSVVFKEVTHLDLKEYLITVKEEVGENNTILIAYNRAVKKADTAQISGGDYEGAELNILDVSDSLQIKPLFLEIITPTGSDWYDHSFVGYDSGKLKELFQLSNWPYPTRLNLYRKDNGTIAGSVLQRDDLVAAFEQYPVVVSLKDYKVTFPDVPALHIGWESTVLTGFKARRVGHEQLPDSIYAVKKGARVMVDTLYTNLGKVRLVIHDSIILEVPKDRLDGKITVNAAG
ncbi:hypothetical protein Q4E93_09705 [Flavitalea sp. BT771]|uniref:hypothetical protein n=1 Tax=Flavitalea sp. BT771 TaxID=3063329 RepID=UPI0026E45F75|nr:hypothetical protein [Flavitalea sp. BT771]MDO6430865.1 hypothetical protein [Flavitalea sp. BT771]MDV6218995.1 hypothetical protein [Flavitalea sp. BT771]